MSQKRNRRVSHGFVAVSLDELRTLVDEELPGETLTATAVRLGICDGDQLVHLDFEKLKAAYAGESALLDEVEDVVPL